MKSSLNNTSLSFQWRLSEGLWQGKLRKQTKVHQERLRRARRGEWVQIDGSPHDWFEGRAPSCTLIVFIDDATSNLLPLRQERLITPTERCYTALKN